MGDIQATQTPTARDRFQYGPNGQRFYREISWWDEAEQAVHTEKTFIVGKYEDVLPANDPDYQRIQKTRIDRSVLHIAATDLTGITVGTLEYLHWDHLGSVEKVTDEAGNVILDTAFDAFGKRRSADWQSKIQAQELEELLGTQGLTTRRGFTGHEHLDRTGLIHMNGRIYDPTLGRFLSGDPFVQAPVNSQSWNRYSYVLNSPLNFTDPSGHLWEQKFDRDGGGCSLTACWVNGTQQWSMEQINNVKRDYMAGTGGSFGGEPGNSVGGTSGDGNEESEEGGPAEEQKIEEVVCNTDPVTGVCGGNTAQEGPGYFDKSLTMIRSSLNWREVKRQFWRTLEAFPGSGTVSGTAKFGTFLAIAKVAPKTLFRTSHYAPRLEAAGLNVAHVESIVAKQIAPMTAHLTPKALFTGRVTVDGVLIEYRAMTLPNGSVNVGTIFPVK